MSETIFSYTQDAIRIRIGEIQDDIEKCKQEIKQLDSLKDGDMMDDPLLHSLLERQELQNRELLKFRGFLSSDYITISVEQLIHNSTVAVGHEIDLKVTYSDGIEDEFTVTIGSVVDKLCLSKAPIYHRYFDDSSKILISEDAPLAQAIIGKSINQIIKYQTSEGLHKAKIINFKPSPLLFEG